MECFYFLGGRIVKPCVLQLLVIVDVVLVIIQQLHLVSLLFSPYFFGSHSNLMDRGAQ